MTTRSTDPATAQFVREQIARIDKAQAELALVRDEMVRRRQASPMVRRTPTEPSIWPALMAASVMGPLCFAAGALFYLYVLKG